ncbi:MAG: DUF3363 domain-containing protein [Pseudomonadota bacterium]
MKSQYARRVIVKARFVRTAMSSPKALAEHLRYISRDSATREEDQGRVFDGETDNVVRDEFAEAAKNDRHHFRFIVSPEDGTEMADLKPFVRDLVSTMEKDLGTRLEWVGAVHDNTDYPHAHIVVRGKRDDGRDLVIPRAYMSHGIRGRAEELVTFELGPQSQLEKDIKLARQSGVERLTKNDRSLARLRSPNGVINLRNTPPRYRAVNASRLRKLQSLGLAHHIAHQSWKLADGFEITLKELGERSDIIKQMNKALRGKSDRALDPMRSFATPGPHTVKTGMVLQTGLRGEGHDQPYIILDGLNGRVVSFDIDPMNRPEDLHRGMIIAARSADVAPRPADETIAAIARDHGGTYSASLHQSANPRSSPTFIAAHVRRLEAMRRAEIVTRQVDATWQIPPDYLNRVQILQERRALRAGANVEVLAWGDLESQISAAGLTWLDETPMSANPAYGFGKDVQNARSARRHVLVERGIISHAEKELDPQTRAALRQRGLDAAGNELAQRLAKPYHPLTDRGAVAGVYREMIVRPEGKFAVIERQRSFTIVPWRKAMDRSLGRQVSGVVRGQSISWNLGKSKSIGI